eukprot:1312336-Pleurochrysis_carterae.AAC.3
MLPSEPSRLGRSCNRHATPDALLLAPRRPRARSADTYPAAPSRSCRTAPSTQPHGSCSFAAVGSASEHRYSHTCTAPGSFVAGLRATRPLMLPGVSMGGPAGSPTRCAASASAVVGASIPPSPAPPVSPVPLARPASAACTAASVARVTTYSCRAPARSLVTTPLTTAPTSSCGSPNRVRRCSARTPRRANTSPRSPTPASDGTVPPPATQAVRGRPTRPNAG